MSNALEVRGLKKTYGDFSLKDVSFEIPQGFIMGFIGPNGAGKTTTIKSILNMIHYEAGQVKVFGVDSKAGGVGASDHGAKTSSNMARALNEEIGVVMDSPLYVDEWTMSDVEKAVSLFYSKWDSGKYDRLLREFGIDKKKKVKELSRGMKVKLTISVALSHDAKLLILDEPTSGLDPVARDELCDMLADFVTDERRSILFSTHITTDLERIADYITFILNGRILFTGAKEDLIEKYVLVKGGLDEIGSEHKDLILGMRKHGTGFEGLAEVSDTGKLPGSLLFEPVTLDEIIVFINKEMKNHG